MQDFNFDQDMTGIDFELTAEEIELCDRSASVSALQNDVIKLLEEVEIASAKTPFERYWAGSASASIARHHKAGKVRTIRA